MNHTRPQQSEPVLRQLNTFVLAYEHVHGRWRRQLGISAHERLALSYLSDRGPMTMSELGESIPLSRAAITTLSDRLEELGYLRRVPDTEDRRRTMLHATDKRQVELQHVVEPLEQRFVELMDDFDEREREAINRFLDRGKRLFDRHSEWLRSADAPRPPAATAGPSRSTQ